MPPQSTWTWEPLCALLIPTAKQGSPYLPWGSGRVGSSALGAPGDGRWQCHRTLPLTWCQISPMSKVEKSKTRIPKQATTDSAHPFHSLASCRSQQLPQSARTAPLQAGSKWGGVCWGITTLWHRSPCSRRYAHSWCWWRADPEELKVIAADLFHFNSQDLY